MKILDLDLDLTFDQLLAEKHIFIVSWKSFCFHILENR